MLLEGLQARQLSVHLQRFLIRVRGNISGRHVPEARLSQPVNPPRQQKAQTCRPDVRDAARGRFKGSFRQDWGFPIRLYSALDACSVV